MLYESVIHPVTIISTLPSAGVGALLLLMAAHFDLSVIAIVGIILLIGIVKKNGIMLVNFAQQVEHSEGLTAEEAIYQACLLRFRPILMTTMAALLGAVPMMGWLGESPAARLRHRRRPRCFADSDPLHDAGHLYLLRPAAELGDAKKKDRGGLRRRRAAACGMTGKSYT